MRVGDSLMHELPLRPFVLDTSRIIDASGRYDQGCGDFTSSLITSVHFAQVGLEATGESEWHNL